jgi:hypothetical protein
MSTKCAVNRLLCGRAAVIFIVMLSGCSPGPTESTQSKPVLVNSLIELLALQPEAIAQVDIARMNLLCAEGLPGVDRLDMAASLAVVEQMAARVQMETARHRYRFQQKPAEFEHSEGYFRMMMLMVVLAEDFKVHYAPDKMISAAQARSGDGFFANAADVFLPGLTGISRRGTCSSLPVLYVAVGRRLGYPLKLVTTRGHLFVRWEDERERFNFEAAGNGANRFSDDYYRTWPLAVSEAEIQADGHLRSLDPVEELGVFLSIRGMCLAEVGRFGEAAGAFGHAAQLVPGCCSYARLHDEMAIEGWKSVLCWSTGVRAVRISAFIRVYLRLKSIPPALGSAVSLSIPSRTTHHTSANRSWRRRRGARRVKVPAA